MGALGAQGTETIRFVRVVVSEKLLDRDLDEFALPLAGLHRQVGDLLGAGGTALGIGFNHFGAVAGEAIVAVGAAALPPQKVAVCVVVIAIGPVAADKQDGIGVAAGKLGRTIIDADDPPGGVVVPLLPSGIEQADERRRQGVAAIADEDTDIDAVGGQLGLAGDRAPRVPGNDDLDLGRGRVAGCNFDALGIAAQHHQ